MPPGAREHIEDRLQVGPVAGVRTSDTRTYMYTTLRATAAN